MKRMRAFRGRVIWLWGLLFAPLYGRRVLFQKQTEKEVVMTIIHMFSWSMRKIGARSSCKNKKLWREVLFFEARHMSRVSVLKEQGNSVNLIKQSRTDLRTHNAILLKQVSYLCATIHFQVSQSNQKSTKEWKDAEKHHVSWSQREKLPQKPPVPL